MALDDQDLDREDDTGLEDSDMNMDDPTREDQSRFADDEQDEDADMKSM